MEASKNTEDYSNIIDRFGEPMEDYEAFDRTIYRLQAAVCPFPDCTWSSWDRAKKEMWSLESEDQVLCYLKQHGMNSTLHGQHKTNPLSEEDVDKIVDAQRPNVVCSVDDYKTREEWRAANREAQKRKAADDARWEQTNKKGRGGQKQHEQQQVVASVGHLAHCMAQQQQQMQQQMNMIASMAAGSSSSAAGHTDAIASSAAGHTQAYIADAIATAEVTEKELNLTSVQEKMVTIPISQLLLYKETVARAKEAVKGAMANMMVPLNQLRCELGVLANAEEVLNNVVNSQK